MTGAISYSPSVKVPALEFNRLAGYPSHQFPEGHLAEKMADAQEWYTQHGRPWVHGHHLRLCETTETEVHLESGHTFCSPFLASRFRKTGAHAIYAVAVSAGAEVSERITALWREDCPDEAYLLDTFASAVVEQLTHEVRARLCEQVDPAGMGVLPHHSPGYDGWGLCDQTVLFEMLAGGTPAVRGMDHAHDNTQMPLTGPLELFPAGMLKPKHSLLGVYGLTRRLDLIQNTELNPCVRCRHATCTYRRRVFDSHGEGHAVAS